MQIGHGKQGVVVKEYANKQPDGIIGWIEPACDNPRWVMWFDVNGNAVLYTDREDGGAVVGSPIRIKARRPSLSRDS